MAIPDEDPLFLDEFLPYRLSVLTNRMSDLIAGIYRERFGLTVAEWRVMAVLGLEAPLSAGEVSQRTAMDKVRVSRAVNRMSRAGLLARHRDRADRRRQQLALSDRGRAIYSEIVPVARAVEAKIFASLEPADRGALDRLLVKLDERVKALADEPEMGPKHG